MKDSIKMIAAIVIFATVACVGLAFVYDATKPVIEANTKKKTEEAQKQLFPDAQFETITGKISSSNPAVTFGEQYLAKSGSGVAGVIIHSSSGAFNDVISALVGVAADGSVTGVQILYNTDTPGLGANASSPSYFVDKPAKTKTFYGQFAGMKSGIAVKQDGGDVVAITAATISSRAVALLVSEAAKQGGAYLQGGF